MTIEKNLKMAINFYKLCIPVITWNKKHLWKQVVPEGLNEKETQLHLYIF